MLTMFGVGIVVGVLIIIGLLRLTMSEEPTGCLIGFGTLFLLFFLALIIVPQLLLAG